MVAYRSFNPFIPLLRAADMPAVQLWAVWAILHVCTKNGQRYCCMLQEEKVSDLLESLAVDMDADENVRNIASKVVYLLTKNDSKAAHMET